MRQVILIITATLLLSNCKGQNDLVENRSYICKQIDQSIEIDGQIDEIWANATWSGNFVDIEGNKRPKPKYDTRIKMLWDTNYFYILAELEEPHVWAKIKERDAVIFYDNDFELFIDPDGDTHNYTEIEVNAFNTIWDLLLTKPYRNLGHALDQFDIKGLKSAIGVQGTLNDPSDRDKGWVVEMAIPWKSFHETTSAKTPPKNNHVWRMNFSRVQWETEIKDGTYVKVLNEETGKPLPEMNWVWSPQRIVNMHEPEFWGTVVFKTLEHTSEDYYADFISEEIRQRLYQIHLNQSLFKKDSGYYKTEKEGLLEAKTFLTGNKIEWDMVSDRYNYHIIMQHPQDRMLFWHLDQSGRIWREIRE